MMRLRRFSARAWLLALASIAMLSTTSTAAASGEADLSLTRFEGSGPPEYQYRAFNGEVVYFIVDVTNRGPADATGVTITQSLPAQFEYLADLSDDRCAATGSTVTCTISTLAAAASDTVLVYTQALSAGTYSSSVTISSDQADPIPDNNSGTSTVTVAQAADIGVTASDSSDPIRSGQVLTYTVVMVNNGPDTASNVSLDVTWQSYGPTMTFVGSSADGVSCVVVSDFEVTCGFATLAVGEQFALTVDLSVALSQGSKGIVELAATGVTFDQFDLIAKAPNTDIEQTDVTRRRLR